MANAASSSGAIPNHESPSREAVHPEPVLPRRSLLADHLEQRFNERIAQLQEELERREKTAQRELIAKILAGLAAYEAVSKLLAEFRPAAERRERDQRRRDEMRARTKSGIG